MQTYERVKERTLRRGLAMATERMNRIREWEIGRGMENKKRDVIERHATEKEEVEWCDARLW